MHHDWKTKTRYVTTWKLTRKETELRPVSVGMSSFNIYNAMHKNLMPLKS